MKTLLLLFLCLIPFTLFGQTDTIKPVEYQIESYLLNNTQKITDVNSAKEFLEYYQSIEKVIDLRQKALNKYPEKTNLEIVGFYYLMADHLVAYNDAIKEFNRKYGKTKMFGKSWPLLSYLNLKVQ
jgi:hypothetical protein